MLRLKAVTGLGLLLWTELCPPAAPANSRAKAPPPPYASVTVFGDRVFKEVIKGGTLIQ